MTGYFVFCAVGFVCAMFPNLSRLQDFYMSGSQYSNFNRSGSPEKVSQRKYAACSAREPGISSIHDDAVSGLCHYCRVASCGTAGMGTRVGAMAPPQLNFPLDPAGLLVLLLLV